MGLQGNPQQHSEINQSRQLVDVYIKVGLIAILLLLCYTIFKPFMNLVLWAVILAVTMYPLHRAIWQRLGGKQSRAAIVLFLCSVLLIVLPSMVLFGSFGDSIHHLIDGVKGNTLKIPAPSEKLADWPIIGKKLQPIWAQAHEDLPALIKSYQPKIGSITKHALALVASATGTMLTFFFAWLIACVMMTYGESGAKTARAIFNRLVGHQNGESLNTLTTATIRTVAQGVIGVAIIQTIVIGIILLLADIPYAGILALITLLFCIAQVPALLITLPVIAYIWMSGHYETLPAVVDTVLLVLAGLMDNVLKPIMLGRGVNVPMPVILLGALGGMASNGIMGMFFGAVILALGYQIFMQWVKNDPYASNPQVASEPIGKNADETPQL